MTKTKLLKPIGTVKIEDLSQTEYYSVMIVDKNQNKLAYLKDGVWTINGTTEEILNAIFINLNPQKNDN